MIVVDPELATTVHTGWRLASHWHRGATHQLAIVNVPPSSRPVAATHRIPVRHDRADRFDIQSSAGGIVANPP